MIQNASEIPLYGIRLLGHSTKTSDQIGKFGTGLKEAICLCLRRKLEIVIYSGDCRIEFSVRGEPAEMHFKMSKAAGVYAAETWYGLGLSPDFGKHDWGTEWQILREVFCNAIDAGGHYFDLTDKIKGVPGATRVFIEADFELLNAYSDVPLKLLMLNNTPQESIMPKNRLGGNVQIYHKGVWVAEFGPSSLYNYQLENIKLTESRSVDLYQVQLGVADRINHCTDEEIIVRLLRNMDTGEAFEYSFDWHLNPKHPKLWKDLWIKLYGLDSFAFPDSVKFNEKYANNGTPVIVPKGVFEYLRRCGVPTSDELWRSDYNVMDAVDLGEFWGIFGNHLACPKAYMYLGKEVIYHKGVYLLPVPVVDITKLKAVLMHKYQTHYVENCAMTELLIRYRKDKDVK
jgi:hypothetical protein